MCKSFKPAQPFVDFASRLPNTKMSLLFDIGANIGQTVMEMRHALPSATIYSFEPIRASFEQLAAEFSGDAHVHCHRLGFGASGGILRMRAEGTSTGNRVITGQPRAGLEVEEVSVVAGDDFCAQRGIERISFLKVDTEGHDLAVLAGFAGMIRQEKIDVLQVEAGMNPTNKRHVSFQQFIGFLAPFGYHLFNLYELTLEKRGVPMLRRVNAVFLSPSVVRANSPA